MNKAKRIKRIIRSAPGRLALVGNPSDIYGGSTIALTLRTMRSYVCIERDEKVHQEISSQIYRPGNNRNQPKNELEHAVIEELDLQYDYFKLFDVSDMPYETGFARSTAAVVAMIRAFNNLFDLGIIENKDIAELAWRVERKLGVCGGQERYAIAYDSEELSQETLEKIVQEKLQQKSQQLLKQNPKNPAAAVAEAGKLFFMDFPGREHHRFDNTNYALVHELTLPDIRLAAAYSTARRSSSFSYHQALREIFRNNEAGKDIILYYADKFHLTARRALGELLSKAPSLDSIAECMSESLNLRFEMFKELSRRVRFDYGDAVQETQKMRDIAEANGAYGINQPGSKSIVFIYNDNKPLEALQKAGYPVVMVKC